MSHSLAPELLRRPVRVLVVGCGGNGSGHGGLPGSPLTGHDEDLRGEQILRLHGGTIRTSRSWSPSRRAAAANRIDLVTGP